LTDRIRSAGVKLGDVDPKRAWNQVKLFYYYY
jgi:hypothetical protein